MSYKVISKNFRGCFRKMELDGCFKESEKVCHGSFKGLLGSFKSVLRECFKEVEIMF